MYSAQTDLNGHCIICKGTDQRRGYSIAYIGTYAECTAWKVDYSRAYQ